MRKNLLFFFTLLCSFVAVAQPELVVDFNPDNNDAFDCFLCTGQPTARVRTGIVTVARTAETGAELSLLLDGQFELLKDINPGTGNGNITFLASRAGLAYFAAKDPINGGAVWVTDGSEAGTVVYFDPDPSNTSASITGMEFGENGALYVVLGTTLYRFFDGVSRQLATSVTLSTSNDNYPGGSMTPYNEGVAYLSNGSELTTGGVFYATDTVRRLAFIPGQRGFDQAFDPREVNGNILFSLEASGNNLERRSAYVYDAAGDSLRRYLNEAGQSLFVDRWYELSDSQRIGRVFVNINRDDYFVFDGRNAPVKLFGEGRFTLAARQTAPAVRVGDTLVWQTEGGTFNDVVVKITDGTAAGTSTIFESTLANNITNLLHAGGYVFFVANVGFRGPLDFYRYELATGELVNFYSVPALAEGNPNYSLQLLDVQDSQLYFAGNLDAALGRELYRIDTEVDIVATRNARGLEKLAVSFTAETFTINAERPGMADLTVFDLSGRLLERETVGVNTSIRIPRFSGMRIYVLEYDGKVAVRRVPGR